MKSLKTVSFVATTSSGSAVRGLGRAASPEEAADFAFLPDYQQHRGVEVARPGADDDAQQQREHEVASDAPPNSHSTNIVSITATPVASERTIVSMSA